MFIFFLKHVKQMRVAVMMIFSNWILFTIILFCYKTFYSFHEQNFSQFSLRRVQIRIYRKSAYNLTMNKLCLVKWGIVFIVSRIGMQYFPVSGCIQIFAALSCIAFIFVVCDNFEKPLLSASDINTRKAGVASGPLTAFKKRIILYQ